MMKFKKTLKGGQDYLGRAVRNGFFHIVGGSTLVKLISALSALLLPNIVSQQQFGSFSLPDNLITILLYLNGLGISAAVLRYCAVLDDPAKRKAYFNFSLRFGVLFDFLLIAAASVVIFLLDDLGVYPVTPFEARLLGSLMFTPFFALLFDLIQNYLRASRQNKSYSKTSVLFTAAYALFQIGFAFFFQIYGIIPGRYLAYTVSIVAGLYMLRAMPEFRLKPSAIGHYEKTAIIRYASSAMLANLFSLIMPQIETLVVNKYITDMLQRANFKNASMAPASVQFLTASVIIFVFPYFAKNYKDGRWIFRNALKLYAGLSAVMIAVIPLCVVFTPQIIRTFWPKYYDPQTVHLMRLFWIAFAVNSALRMPTGNILAAIGEIRFNLVNAVAASAVQAVLCWSLVTRFALNGAAYGLLIAYAVSAIIGIVYLWYYCRRLKKKQRLSQSQAGTLPDEQIEGPDP